MMRLPADIVARLRAAGAEVGVAESLTAGLITDELAMIPGSSAVLRGGVVAYATEVKAQVLGVDADLLARGGPVQAAVAEQMVRGARRVLAARYGLATTGVAGPGPADGWPVGTVYIAAGGPVLGRNGRQAATRGPAADGTGGDGTGAGGAVVGAGVVDSAAVGGAVAGGVHVRVRRLHLAGTRQQVRRSTARAALALLHGVLEDGQRAREQPCSQGSCHQ